MLDKKVNDDNDKAEYESLVDCHASTKTSTEHGAGITEWEAGISLAKAIMGAGSFALPWAFRQMGYVAGPIFLGVLMVLSVYSLQLLVTCARATGKQSYVDVCRSTFGRIGARIAYIASISASLGVCGSYLVFIAANLQSLLDSNESKTFQEVPTGMSQTSLILLVLPLVVVLSSVHDMKHFAFASLLGDISVILGMVVVLVYGFLNPKDTHKSQELVAIGSWETMPLAFGAIGYLFLVHFLTLPIEAAMIRPEQFHSVAIITFSVCAVISGSFGVIGYLLFGQETQQIVLLNVHGSYFVSAVKLLLCVDLLLTYPVVMRPSIVIVEQSLINDESSPCKSSRRSNTNAGTVGPTIHLSVCLLLGLVAAAGGIFVPAFGMLSGLVGGVSQTFLAFVLPPLMLTKQRHLVRAGRGEKDLSIFSLLVNKDLGLVGLGVTLILWTLVMTWNELNGGMSL